MKHDVHIYAIVRVKVPGVEAPNPQEAITKALADTDLDATFTRCPGDVEFADEVSHYLVDVADDPEHERSQWFADGANDARVDRWRAEGVPAYGGGDGPHTK
jgi:hypothetical protein